MAVTASAHIHWSSSSARTGVVHCAAHGSTIGDTLDELKERILDTMDDAADEVVLGWNTVQINLLKESSNG